MSSKKLFHFNNNEGIGGFENGLYDSNALQPTEVNWTRQSAFSIPTNPHLLRKVSDDSLVNTVKNNGSFMIDRFGNIILSTSSSNLTTEGSGRLRSIDLQGKIKEIFRSQKTLNTPIIGENGFYMTTTGPMDSRGHKLFCVSPNGEVKWEFLLDNNTSSKPVLDKEGNIYVCTFHDAKGKLFSINKTGKLNWVHEYESLNWYEPIISQKGIIYIGINKNQSLSALDKEGNVIWEKSLGFGFGAYPPVIDQQDHIYISIANKLLALEQNGNIIWEYKPEKGLVTSGPALDRVGNLYFNLNFNRLGSLSLQGEENWIIELKGQPIKPPIIGDNSLICQTSYISNDPYNISFLEVFSDDGHKLWDYEVEGTIRSVFLADNQLIYVHSNRYTSTEEQMIYSWDLYIIGQITMRLYPVND